MNIKNNNTIKVNFTGGIISPILLYNILIAASKANVLYIRFGLRQQLLFDVPFDYLSIITTELSNLGVVYEVNEDLHPNIISSYPAEEVFIIDTWLSEGVYKDIFDLIDYSPSLKINISDCNQSFTPFFTGNINWVASPTAQHYWHLFVRFPKTNIVYEWKDIVYTNDIAKMSASIEAKIMHIASKSFAVNESSGDQLYHLVNSDAYNIKKPESPLVLPPFKLPYYEGLNRYNNQKSWLGIYRRDELFSISFLKELCQLCLNTRVGLLCSTPWKSIIIKGIEEKDRKQWNTLLDKHQINVRHAANELNFQVEDNCLEGLKLKQHLVKYLTQDDTRTFGVCIGIKTRKKSEVFSSILVQKKPLFKIGNLDVLNRYDILCAKNYNPNERTGFAYSTNNPKFLLAEQLRRAILSYYKNNNEEETNTQHNLSKERTSIINVKKNEWVYQCVSCKTIYDEIIGDPENAIEPRTLFKNLPENYTCATCDESKESFKKINKATLGSL